MSLSSIEHVVATLQAGRPVIVADDESRENEGDAIVAAELATPESIAWMVTHSSGLLCAPMSNAVADRLELAMMVRVNEDPRGTAYTVTVDAADRRSTGISAADRAHTLNVLADRAATSSAVTRPGHVLPLRARDGGVRVRAGHTEAAVDLMRLAGLEPVAAIAELTAPDGSMRRLPDLLAFGAAEGVPVTTTAALIAHLDAHPHLAERTGITAPPPPPGIRVAVETRLPTARGVLTVRAYSDARTGDEHIALVAGEVGRGSLVRVHRECLTGEAFGSLRCGCGPRLDAALDRIAAEGGVVVYLRGQEGRGAGLLSKLRAYRLQEEGLDPLDANLALGLPTDSREYLAVAVILGDLGVDDIRLLTDDQDQVARLEAQGVHVAERLPLVVGAGLSSAGHPEARARVGHLAAVDAAAAVGVPEVAAPTVAVPTVAVPAVAAPEFAVPAVAAPEVAVPEVAPDAVVAGAVAPDAVVVGGAVGAPRLPDGSAA